MSLESLVLDGTELNDYTTFRLQGFDFLPGRKRYEWASGADADGEALVRDPLHENAVWTLRLRVAPQASMNTALAKIAQVTALLEEAERNTDGLALVWTPAGATAASAKTAYVLSGEIDGLPITNSGDDQGWLLRAPVMTVKLICKPFLHGAETTTTIATASTLPLITGTLANVPGDVPALGRLIVTDAATQFRRHVEWGLEQRYYNPATSLILDSDSLVTTGFTGTGTTRTGAYDPGATGNNVVRVTLYGQITAVCGTGNLAHVGTFRVKARVFASNTASSTAKLRLAWQSGDGPLRANAWTSPPIGGAFAEVDLGVITIAEAQLGTQKWSGRIEAYTDGGNAGTDTLDIDYLLLIPAGEGYGKARATVSTTPGVLVASDEFTGTTAGGALNARAAPLGGSWVTSGSATDLTFSDSPERVTRATTSDASPRFAILGATNYTDTEVALTAASAKCYLIVRWTDSSNYAYLEVGNSALLADTYVAVYTVVAGVTTLRAYTPGGTPAPPTERRLRVTAYASGRVIGTLMDSTGVAMLTVDTSSSALATGGALATGKPGFADYHPAATALTRYYDSFSVSTPAAEPIAVYSGQSLEIRHDGQALREDSSGTYYGSVPSYRGARFVVPPAGSANRTTRISVKARRNEVDTSADDQIADATTVQVAVTPRYLTPYTEGA